MTEAPSSDAPEKPASDPPFSSRWAVEQTQPFGRVFGVAIASALLGFVLLPALLFHQLDSSLHGMIGLLCLGIPMLAGLSFGFWGLGSNALDGTEPMAASDFLHWVKKRKYRAAASTLALIVGGALTAVIPVSAGQRGLASLVVTVFIGAAVLIWWDREAAMGVGLLLGGVPQLAFLFYVVGTSWRPGTLNVIPGLAILVVVSLLLRWRTSFPEGSDIGFVEAAWNLVVLAVPLCMSVFALWQPWLATDAASVPFERMPFTAAILAGAAGLTFLAAASSKSPRIVAGTLLGWALATLPTIPHIAWQMPDGSSPGFGAQLAAAACWTALVFGVVTWSSTIRRSRLAQVVPPSLGLLTASALIVVVYQDLLIGGTVAMVALAVVAMARGLLHEEHQVSDRDRVRALIATLRKREAAALQNEEDRARREREEKLQRLAEERRMKERRKRTERERQEREERIETLRAQVQQKRDAAQHRLLREQARQATKTYASLRVSRRAHATSWAEEQYTERESSNRRSRSHSRTQRSGPTHYDTLDVSVDATAEQIKQAYMTKAQILHPDRMHSFPDHVRKQAENDFKKVSAAYSVLRDEAQRRAYDEELGVR